MGRGRVALANAVAFVFFAIVVDVFNEQNEYCIKRNKRSVQKSGAAAVLQFSDRPI